MDLTLKKKRKSLSIADKVQIIREIECGAKNSHVCKKYGLPSSTVSTLMKNKESYITTYLNNVTNVKKRKKCELHDVDKELLQFYKIQKNAGLSTSGPVLKLQAEFFARKLGHDKFVCSDGWLDRFKNRHNLKNKSECEDYLMRPSLPEAQDALDKLVAFFQGDDNADVNSYRALNFLREKLFEFKVDTIQLPSLNDSLT